MTREPAAITWGSGSLCAEDIGTTGLTLTWPAASSGAGIAEYKVYRGDALISTVAASIQSLNVAGLFQGTSYDFSVTEAPAAAKTIEVSLPKQAVDAAADSGISALTMSTPLAVITFDDNL